MRTIAAPLPDPATMLAEPADLPLSRRYVRVVQRADNGLVAFEFAIGWPDLVQELVLAVADFDAFCVQNQVIRLPDGPRGSSELQPDLA